MRGVRDHESLIIRDSGAIKLAVERLRQRHDLARVIKRALEHISKAFEVARVEIAAIEPIGLKPLKIRAERDRDPILLARWNFEYKPRTRTQQMNRIVPLTHAVAGRPAHKDAGRGIDFHSCFRRCEIE